MTLDSTPFSHCSGQILVEKIKNLHFLLALTTRIYMQMKEGGIKCKIRLGIG